MCLSLIGPDNHQKWVANIHLFFRYAKVFANFVFPYNKTVMDPLFDYDKPASGRNFIGRKNDVNYLSNMLFAGDSVALYGEPHDGRRSLVNQTLTFLQMSGKGLGTVTVDLMSARTNEDVLSRYLTEVLRFFAPSLDEVMDIYGTYFEDMPLTFDGEAYMSETPYIIFDGRADGALCRRIISIPYELAERHDMHIAIIFKSFQNANADSEAHVLLKAFEAVLAARKGRCSMVFMGGRMNAMKEIFEVRRYFWKDVVIYPLGEVTENEAGDYVLRCFQSKGKVIDRNLIHGCVKTLRVNMWYVNIFFSILDYVSIGYANDRSLAETWGLIMSMFRGKFVSQMADLTDFQIRLLKAVIDGETRLGSVAVVENYKLNSSANVKRLKYALIKKEVLWFDEKDVPHIQDVLFELWLRKEYFSSYIL